jgi:hypothetical protein
MFQQSVNVTQAPAVAGDFASANPRFSQLSVPGGFVSGQPNGVTVGRFAWMDATGTILQNSGSGPPSCFIHRALEGINYIYLSNGSMVIPPGQGIGEMFMGGDFYAKNDGAGASAVMMKAFANTTNGTVSFAAAGATVAGSVETKWYCHRAVAAGELSVISDHSLG